ncbi:MAG: NAD(P)H-hydrate dehydratase [Muribaculaceae bacterium]|nr:NAD(P)H-hydrate dehydratase [Muribaculaceae bacterium]
MNIYSPGQIDYIIERTLGESPEQRMDFIRKVGTEVAENVGSLRRKNKRVVIFAGNDINGAYAMEAGVQLALMGYAPEVYLINIGGDRLTADARTARQDYVEAAGEEALFETTGMELVQPDLSSSDIVVEGLFGREHGGPLMGGYQYLARFINESGAFVVSIDLPAGMTVDLSVGMINRNIIHANITLTLVGPSTAFFMKENAELVGRWQVLDVDMDEEAMKATKCHTRLIEAHNVRKLLPPRNEFVSKADLGHALLYAGSYGMLGAAVLSARGALRSGCGKLTVHGPRCGFFVLQTSVPSAMFMTDGGDMDIRRMDYSKNYTAIGVGPGIGTSDATVAALEGLLKAANAASFPLILDADALNCMALRPSMLDFLPARSVITPHEGEFDRLFGKQPSSSARLLKAIEISHKLSIIIVLKGHYTATIWPDGSVLLNSSGTPALATAGSGDVLTGLITGLVASGIHPEYAAAAGVYIHGLAGHFAARTQGVRSVTADDVAASLGPAMEAIDKPRKQA